MRRRRRGATKELFRMTYTASGEETVENVIDAPVGVPFNISWGDGNSDSFTGAGGTSSGQTANHTYVAAGTYNITIFAADMTYFDIRDQGYTGDMSKNAGILKKWTSIVRFYIYANSFTGDISGWDLSTWTNIQDFYINSNSFTGDISSWNLSGWTNIAIFSIHHNSFTGDISGWDLSTWTNIQDFYINHNSFTGDISSWNLSGWTNITRFYINANSLTGDISSWNLSGWTNIAIFYIYANSFTGDISSWNLSGWTNITRFYIYANSFTGDISSWNLSGWTNITKFYINANSFTKAPGTLCEAFLDAAIELENNDITDSDDVDAFLGELASLIDGSYSGSTDISDNTAPSDPTGLDYITELESAGHAVTNDT